MRAPLPFGRGNSGASGCGPHSPPLPLKLASARIQERPGINVTCATEPSLSQRAAFRAAAEHLPGIDREAYATFGRDWRDPIIGLGPRDARLCILGRDPGGTEVELTLPFVGKGGQLVRAALHRQLHGAGAATPDLAASIAAGRGVFWLNTVPYKPVGKRAWSMAVKQRFQPLMADLLLNTWQGQGGERTVIALGREAFFWFGIAQPPEVRSALDAFWAQGEARYRDTLRIALRLGGASHPMTLAPLPHPSPANAVWFSRFPALMDARLRSFQGCGWRSAR